MISFYPRILNSEKVPLFQLLGRPLFLLWDYFATRSQLLLWRSMYLNVRCANTSDCISVLSVLHDALLCPAPFRTRSLLTAGFAYTFYEGERRAGGGALSPAFRLSQTLIKGKQ